jgi:hypothetical protein
VTRRHADHRARVVPQASVFRPLHRDGFLQGGFHTRAAAMRTPAPQATATQRRCSFALTRDAAASRCGASTPHRVFLLAGLRAVRVVSAGTCVHASCTKHTPVPRPRLHHIAARTRWRSTPSPLGAELCSPCRRPREPAFVPCLIGWLGTCACGDG